MTKLSDTLHALLIGIDAYPVKPLFGCVNDVDAVHAVLRKLGIPDERIHRLTSPHVSSTDKPATLANMQAAFTALATRAQPGERVFVYYSGHGTSVPDASGRFHREALVPVDVDAAAQVRVLYDDELNVHLANLAKVTSSVTLILDCCHAAGATREMGTSRSFDLSTLRPSVRGVAPPAVPITRGNAPRVGHSVDDCHVVAACLNHESAYERVVNGTHHGMLTYALLQAFGERTPDHIAELTWGHIWEQMRAVAEASKAQHLWMSGSTQREVFAGQPVHGDAGFRIAADGDRFRIAAGDLAGLGKDAVLAVYGEQPRVFPPRDSEMDRKACAGTVRVIESDRAWAVAVATEPFELPAAPRARLVQLGEAARLRVAVDPLDQRAIARLSESTLLKLVTGSEVPEAKLKQVTRGWALVDDVHDLELALFTLPDDNLVHAREMFEHYFRYAQPLRMANRLESSHPGTLTLEVLDARGMVAGVDAYDPDLPRAPASDDSHYTLKSGAEVCFRVRNMSSDPMRVTLVNAAANGCVEFLGDQVVDADRVYTFWKNNNLKKPIEVWLPSGMRAGIDRLIAFATTSLDCALGYLKVDESFETAVPTRTRSKMMGDKPVGVRGPTKAVPERWTATQVVIRTSVS